MPWTGLVSVSEADCIAPGTAGKFQPANGSLQKDVSMFNVFFRFKLALQLDTTTTRLNSSQRRWAFVTSASHSQRTEGKQLLGGRATI